MLTNSVVVKLTENGVCVCMYVCVCVCVCVCREWCVYGEWCVFVCLFIREAYVFKKLASLTGLGSLK
jgi:hypothetical protein